MTKIHDIPYGVLFEFLVRGTDIKIRTTLIEDVLMY